MQRAVQRVQLLVGAGSGLEGVGGRVPGVDVEGVVEQAGRKEGVPNDAPTDFSRSTCGRPITSVMICGHRLPVVPPPTATTRSIGTPASAYVSTLCRTPNAVASSAAR